MFMFVCVQAQNTQGQRTDLPRNNDDKTPKSQREQTEADKQEKRLTSNFTPAEESGEEEEESGAQRSEAK